MAVGEQELARLSGSQAKFVSFVDILAMEQGGATADIVRSGRFEVYPGTVLTAEVVNVVPVPEEGPQLIYGLSAQAVGYHEEVTVDPNLVHTDLVVDEGQPHGADSAPDYAIESFLDRFYVGKIVEAATQNAESSTT